MRELYAVVHSILLLGASFVLSSPGGSAATLAGVLPDEIDRHYAGGVELGWLERGGGRLELQRTRELLVRFLAPAPARVLDVGGGPGVYAGWLAEQGYEVSLVDAMPLHVEQARELGMFAARGGDARSLDETDESFDAVLLLGLLYHLTERRDRLLALREARRVLCGGGIVAAGAISRFASVIDGLVLSWLGDPRFRAIVEGDLATGQHRNPGDEPGWFTTAFFHHPDELAAEVREAGLELDVLLAVEGIAWLLNDLDERIDDPDRREQLLWAISALEGEPALLGATAHLLAIGRRADAAERR
jgi:SAM-dependent methyltransferase